MDKSYAESIASDILYMLKSAKDGGLDLNSGFQNDAFKAENFSFGYLFYPREMLLDIPTLPQEVRKKVKKANILGTVELEGKKVGIYLICSFTKGFDEIETEEDIVAAVNNKELMDFKEKISGILQKDLTDHMEK